MTQEEYPIPSDDELRAFAVDWWQHFGFVADSRHEKATYVNDVIHVDHFASFARDLLAKYAKQSFVHVRN
jgi:hypothetical protein